MVIDIVGESGALDLNIAVVETDMFRSHTYCSFHIQSFGDAAVLVSVDVYQRKGPHVDDLREDVKKGSFGFVLGVVKGDDVIAVYLSVRR
ncbi:hypothetical protein SDC9_79269 [bioreactor metagenome]|uniref:Uncharacterized protein n=1 Tax=bioreactor metagenome TaxID=1076179 RepID=A0A644Z3K4_9ZZZZ